jgi:3-phosphoshikimate 1-carboxyvinyltransferase
MNYKVSHPTKVVNCEISLPSSKSISNRLLIIRALCEENIKIENLSESDDTQILAKALISNERIIDISHAGTSLRFLTSFLCLQKNKEFILTGSDRIKERPIKELVEVLQKMGAKIKYLEQKGFAPLKILGSKIIGGCIQIDGGISSQFISAILLIAPILDYGIELKITGELVSKPYVLMTLKIMSEFGVKSSWNENIIKISKQNYTAKKYTVESDWSCASFWLQIASLSEKCKIKLSGLKQDSIQGDKKVLDIFDCLGVSSVFSKNKLILTKQKDSFKKNTINLIENPDLYQPLKCTLYAKNIDAEFSGLQTLRNKETDRFLAVTKEIKQLNSSKIIKTYNDHRMAMSFAPMCLVFEELQINNAEVVNKSYPNFWNDLMNSGFIISPLSD